ncbi:MAG: hypothetical protein OQJ89_08725 [Kangiellaceae bacterium]|nr:hypothetical protein [Kangiellaceae bacterium]MCW8999868.1 hypothetical protein [Kangiellaceae bacterium]MCW9017033.1 hypothetical protein [Kangiellaceae bacterium]
MQHINFYFDEFKPKPLSFDIRFSAAVISLIVIGMLVIGILQHQKLLEFEQLQQQKAKQAAALNEQVKQLQHTLKQNRTVQNIEKEHAYHQAQLQQYQQALNILSVSEQDSFDPFSQILADLSERKADSLWLTQINIDGVNLSLLGTTTKARSIPLYVDDLKNAVTLNREFDDLKILRDQENKRLINFELVNGRKIYER